MAEGCQESLFYLRIPIGLQNLPISNCNLSLGQTSGFSLYVLPAICLGVRALFDRDARAFHSQAAAATLYLS